MEDYCISSQRWLRLFFLLLQEKFLKNREKEKKRIEVGRWVGKKLEDFFLLSSSFSRTGIRSWRGFFFPSSFSFLCRPISVRFLPFLFFCGFTKCGNEESVF